MLTRALKYNYLTVHTQIRKKNYIVHFVTINNEEEKILKLQQLTGFTIFVIVKITTVLIFKIYKQFYELFEIICDKK